MAKISYSLGRASVHGFYVRCRVIGIPYQRVALAPEPCPEGQREQREQRNVRPATARSTGGILVWGVGGYRNGLPVFRTQWAYDAVKSIAEEAWHQEQEVFGGVSGLCITCTSPSVSLSGDLGASLKYRPVLWVQCTGKESPGDTGSLGEGQDRRANRGAFT